MKTGNRLKAWIIFGLYLAATSILLFFGYSIQKPAIPRQEFPFTITYSYQGDVQTISDVYVAEYIHGPKYIWDEAVAWSGYVKDKNRLESDFYRIAEDEGRLYSISLNIVTGCLMGDPRYAGAVCQPTALCLIPDGNGEISVTDPGELTQMGFSIVSWEYPAPIENSFSFGGLSLSSEATIYTAAMALAALLACMIFIRKDKSLTYTRMDKISAVLNFPVVIVAFPFILITAVLSELVSDPSFMQQILYLAPAMTVLGIALSVTLRRMGHKLISFWVQFAGPAVFTLVLLIETP